MRISYRALAGILAALAGFSTGARAETPKKHIRVIVDTSASLHKNDPSGYVKLSTELFFDLAVMELEQNDTFKVATFDTTWTKVTEPPATLDDRFVTDPGRQTGEIAIFHRKMRSTDYTTKWTYFSPCIQWAFDDLKNRGTSKDNRVIVLITDGEPDQHVKAADQRRLEQLRGPLRQNNIRLFVLGFSPEARQDWFDEVFQFNSSGGPEGQAFAHGDANHLLPDMLEIFSRSFGFAKETVPDPSIHNLNVARNLTLKRAAVVAIYKEIAGLPDFKLSAPPGKPLGPLQKGVEDAAHDPLFRNKWHYVSYSFQWLQPPEPGEYGFQQASGAFPAEVAILRPVQVQAKIRPYRGNSIDAIMAGKPAPMEVLVYPGEGTAGDPGEDIHVRFYLKYLGQDDRGEHSGRVYLPDPGPGRRTPEGRVFVIRPEFIKDPRGAEPGKPYHGYIDVEVTQFDSPVFRMGPQMHTVEVYPYVSVGVSPHPATVTNRQGKDLIESGQPGCVEIRFSDNTHSLKAERYTLAGRIDNMPETSGPWRGAKFHFDSEDLREYGGAPAWQFNKSFQTSELLEKKHSFCVDIGTPTKELAHQLNLHFGVWSNNASVKERQLNSVEDLAVIVNIAAPGFWQTWGPWIILLLTLLLMYLLFLLWKARLLLAPDLQVSLGRGGGSLQPAPLATRSPIMRLLGISQEKPVVSLAGDRELGKLRPLREGLFSFVPGQGYSHVTVESNGAWLPVEKTGDGSYMVSAGKIYRAGIGADLHSFRVEYSSERPRF